MTLGKRIASLRKQKDITQEYLSKILGISRATIAMYETDKREPDNANLNKLADYFNVSTDYLLCRSEWRNASEEFNNELINSIKNGFKTFIKENINNSSKITHELKSQIINYKKHNQNLNENQLINKFVDTLICSSDLKKVSDLLQHLGYDHQIDEDNHDITYIKKINQTNHNQNYLSEKDEKDVAKHLEETMKILEEKQDSIMFDGEAIDEETKELLRQSLENSMRMAKAMNKKYTPKKYRK